MKLSRAGKWVAAFGAVYLLASGPAFRLVEERILPEPLVLVVYAPLFPLSHVPVIRGVIRVYLQLWMLPPAR
jgi:hypothetical protein